MPIPKARGHVTVDPRSPRAGAVCDRCGERYQRQGAGTNSLQWQFEYQGSGTINLRILVCPVCIDELQPQLLAPRVPADPLPVLNPRPEPYATEEGGPPGPAQPQIRIPPQEFE
jgi:hypothetical protein